jgi:pimeloyl-ACP methyl ester carboxylesterase
VIGDVTPVRNCWLRQRPGNPEKVSTQLSWERAGSGEPLLLLHGIGSTRDDFVALRPALEAEYEVLAVDLPGHGESPALARRPTIAAVADAIEADLDALGYARVHVLGNSIGARMALELARRHRALSVVAIAPSGANLPPERLYQGVVMSTARVALRTIRPVIELLAHTRAGRTALLTGLRSRPWDASEPEAVALREGFADSDDFWRTLFWGILADVPTGLGGIDCPVLLAQGTADVIGLGQTPRYLLSIRGSTFRPLFGAGHAPQSDSPGDILELVRLATRRAHDLQPARG